MPRPETKRSSVFGKIPDLDRDRRIWSGPDQVPIGPGPNFPNTITVVGSIMYAAMATCPDVAFAVQHLSQFNSNPGYAHWMAVQHTIRYLYCHGSSLDPPCPSKASPPPPMLQPISDVFRLTSNPTGSSVSVMNTMDFGISPGCYQVGGSKDSQLFRQQCCKVIYTSKGPCQ